MYLGLVHSRRNAAAFLQLYILYLFPFSRVTGHDNNLPNLHKILFSSPPANRQN
jgi:hypothetical protein